MKQILILTATVFVLMIACISAYAGDLQPPAGDPSSTMVTLDAIYDLVNTKVSSTPAEPCLGAAVPKTGAGGLTGYAFTVGEDGHLNKGVAIPSPRFTDNSNGTVTDNLTGLIWLKDANVAVAFRDWATALSDVTQLNTDGTINGNDCGDTSKGGSHQSDWRLPNRFELESLINFAYRNPCISNTAGDAKCVENDPFINVQTHFYWSSTTYATNKDYAWNVDMGESHIRTTIKSDTNHLWPVRGGID